MLYYFIRHILSLILFLICLCSDCRRSYILEIIIR
uniref:Uncharacterized protein n=1 Tax=Dulem virus 42 TaxID=3145760 RepID=A0AAU8BBS7_9CAUD